MRVIKNYLYNAGYQLLAIIVPLITTPYVSRVLHPVGVGDFSYTSSIIQYFVLIAGMGVGYYGNREIAYLRENRYEMSKAFWEIQIVKTFTTIIAFIIFVLFLYWYEHYILYLCIQAINIIAVAFDISWLYMGVENFKPTVVRNTIFKILSTIMVFIFVRNSNDVGIYILITALSVILGNMALWYSLKNIVVKVKLNELKPFRHLVPSISMFIPQVAIQVYVQLNKTMLGAFVGTVSSGYYQYSDNLVKMVLTIVTATGTVMLPHVSNAFSKGDTNKVNQMLYRSFDFVSFLAIAMMFGLAGVSKYLGLMFYGRGFGPVGMAMIIESIVIVLIGWSNVIGTQYLLPTNKVNSFTVSVTLGAIINIILNVPLIYIWGLYGAMWATVFSEFAVTAYQLWVVRNSLSMRELFKNFWKYMVAGSIMFGCVIYLELLWKPISISSITDIVHLCIIVAVGILVYGIMILLLKPTILDYAKEILFKRKK